MSEKPSKTLRKGKRVWDWRSLAMKYGPDQSNFVLVICVLGEHMSNLGESCFPSVERIAELSSLSKPTVIKYLKLARKEGWIRVEKHGFGGKKWKRNQYTATIPDHVWEELNNASQPSEKAVKELNHDEDEGGKTDSERGKTDEEKVVKELNTNSPGVNSPSNSSGESAHAREGVAEKAVDLYRELATRNPTNVAKDRIRHVVNDLELWEETVRWWVESGYRKANVRGMTEKYEELAEERSQGVCEGLLPESYSEYVGPMRARDFRKAKKRVEENPDVHPKVIIYQFEAHGRVMRKNAEKFGSEKEYREALEDMMEKGHPSFNVSREEYEELTQDLEPA